MQEKFLISSKQKEELFHTELVKHGVPYHKAAKAAKILASNQPEDVLTEEETQLVQEACRVWLKQRQRLNFILQQLATSNSSLSQTLQRSR
ncbi:MAG TPA: hypothetical protein V6C63_15950 [Allocoleopsis sp.]